MRVIIAGSRHFETQYAISLVSEAIRESGFEITEVIHGAARGIDLAADSVCRGVHPIRVFPAEWGKYGNRAGPIRNAQMADVADALILVWDGQSRGSKNMLETARRKGLKVFEKVVRLDHGESVL